MPQSASFIQMDKRGTLFLFYPDGQKRHFVSLLSRWTKEALWIRKTPMYMNRDAGSYQLSHTWDQVISRSRAPLSCKQSRRDQDVRQTSKRCHYVTHFQLCKVRSFYVIDRTN